MESIERLAAAVPDLTVEVPNRRNWFSLRLDQLPPTLAADITDWLAADQGTDPRLRRSRLNRDGHPHRRPIRPRTAESYRRLILEFITMETLTGVPLDSLRTLADVVRPDNVDQGLAQYERRFGGEKRRHLGQVMRVVCLVARHWVRLPAEQVTEMWSWTKDVSVARHDMTAKNKALLVSLRDAQALARLLGLAPKVVREVLSKPRMREADAVRAQVAFAVALLLNAPARIGNIASLHLDRHVRRVGSGKEERVVLEFPGAEVKNGRDLSYPLLDSTKELLDLYLSRIRPKLAKDSTNRWLFPGEGQSAKGSALLSEQIGDLTEEIVGIRITAHQFRHILATLHYSRSGHDAATVARALGNDEATVRQFYAFLSQEEALWSWNEDPQTEAGGAGAAHRGHRPKAPAPAAEQVMSGQRLCLPVADWSPEDQAALRMATTPGLRRARAGRAARWQPATVRIMTEGVGSFLGFLAPSGVATAEAGLSTLCTETRVLDWIAALMERRLTAHTIRFRVTGLQRGCEVMYPFSDWRWLKEIVADLPDGRQESRRRKMHQIRHSRELLELGLRLITSSLSGRYLRPHLRHVVARDGMMIALLASRPLRLKNFTDLRLGRHLIRQEDGRWRQLVPASETKNGQSIEDMLPEDIGRLLDRYLAIDRPVLLARGPTTAGAREDHLWISEDGLPMTSTNVRSRITLETFKAFGVAISPHRFRDAGATTIALEMPAQMDMALALLGDRDPNTIAEHYNMATTLQASLKLAESLEAMMRELGVRSRLD